MKNTKLLLVPILILFKCFIATAQFTAIPDSNFEKALITNNPPLDFGTPDGKVLTENIANVTNLSVYGKNISDLTGIQDFVALKYLACYSNKLTSLDVTKNTVLISLDCYSNQLKTIDLSKNTALTSLFCDNNQLTFLDVSKNTALKYIGCFSNQLTSLDITQNPALITLACYSNKLTSLNLTKNKALIYLYCSSNQITSLDVTQNTAVTTFICYSNKLLTLSGINMVMNVFDATDNPDLTCIQYDGIFVLTGWKKDINASYSTNCSLATPSFVKDETSVLIYPNPASNLISIELENITTSTRVTILDMNSRTLLSKNILDYKTEINISDFTSGIYLVQITTDNVTFSKKILKQ